jgi:hypothetical protein
MKNGDAMNNRNACRNARINKNQPKGNAGQNGCQHELQPRNAGQDGSQD